ncbi:MAG: hypothetical protein GY737_21425 [Desulfobacteraceae bacterium]|nr:hypothetical protein [Desulfobacteraceae bacterium]
MKLEKKIAQKIISLSELDKHIVIAVCGAADLGKSFLSAKLAEILNAMDVSANHLPLDSFLMNRTKRIKNGISGYQPESYNFNAIENQLIKFKNGHDVSFFPYNHSTGEKAQESITVSSCKVLIVDGLHSMHKVLKPYIMLSLFIYTDDKHLREIRRGADIIKRKQSAEFSKKVEVKEYQNYKQFVEPYKEQADLHLYLKEKWKYSLKNKKK